MDLVCDSKAIQCISFMLNALELYENKHNPELHRTDPGTKVFKHLMPKIDCYYFHRFSWEKHSKLIYHMPSIITTDKF